MKICVLGAGGFIGQNLVDYFTKNTNHFLIACDKNIEKIEKIGNSNKILVKKIEYSNETDFDNLLFGVDIVFHLISTCIPGTNGFDLKNDIINNSSPMINLLDSCVKNNVRKVIFLSSGGAIYGNKNKSCTEKDETDPISSYGLQKLLLEKIIYLYNYRFDLNFNIIRLSNPYGPYQKPNRGQGVINTFIYNIYNGKEICIFGDGTNVRDYIYISDAIDMIINISFSKVNGVFNVGSGTGKSINDLIALISKIVGKKPLVKYMASRLNDVKTNTLDINKYRMHFGNPNLTSFDDGIEKTLKFLISGEF